MRGFTTGSNHRARSALSVAIFLMLGLLAVASAPAANAATVSVDSYTTTMASTTPAGTQGTNPSDTPALSADGRFVAFITTSSLVQADTNGVADVYRRDLAGGNAAGLTLVSVNGANNAAGNGVSGSEELDISDDGSKVFFRSSASDLVDGDANGQTDLFVRDYSQFSEGVTPGVTSRVNVPTGIADNSSTIPGPDFFSASADGNLVAFIAYSGLPSGQGVYLRDLAANTTTFRVFADGGQIALSGDGTKIAYSRINTDSGCANEATYELYVWENRNGEGGINEVSNLANRGTSSGFCDVAGVLGPNAMSHDGNIMAYLSDGDAYGPLEPKPRGVYAFNLVAFKAGDIANETVRMSELADGTNANADSGGSTNDWPKGAVSADGTRVAFTSQASNLDANAPNGGAFVKNRVTDEIVAASRANLTNDTTAKAVSNTTINAQGTRVGYATPHALVDNDANGVSDVYVSTYSFPSELPTPLTPSSPALSVDLTDTLPGFSSLPTSAVPPTALKLDALGEIAGAPLRAVDLRSAPLRAVPLRAVPLRAVPLRAVPLRAVTLSEIPLLEGTWEFILAGIPNEPYKGVPLQSVTLDQVLTSYDTVPSPNRLDEVSISDVDLSSTPLRAVSLASVMLGATPLRAVPFDPSPTGTAFGDWCQLIASLGYSCADLGLTSESPLISVDLAGVPLRAVPLRAVPLRAVDLSSAPLRAVPLRAVNLAASPLGTLQLIKLDTAAEVVDCSAGFDCTSPTATLATAKAADRIPESTTLGTLFDNVNHADLPGSLADLLVSMIDTTNYPWQDLPLDGLQTAVVENQRVLDYTATYNVTGDGTGSAVVSVDLPQGFLYKPGSSQIPGIEFSQPYSDPAIVGNKLTWTFNGIGAGSKTFYFSAFPPFDIGAAQASTITVAIGTATATATDQAPVDVDEDWESSIFFEQEVMCANDCTLYEIDPAAAAFPISANELIVGHIGTPGDVDTFKIPVPPKGTRMRVQLGNHSTDADFDVVMYNPAGSSKELGSAPLRAVPLRAVPLADNGVDATAGDSAVSAETLNDIPTLESVPLRAVGENRSTADELITTVSDAEPFADNEQQQYYLLQVTAYNGPSSNEPYVLYVNQFLPPPAPACAAPRTFPHNTAAATSAPTLPENINTLFLVNQKRMGDTYGATATAEAIAKLQSMNGQHGVISAVYPVDSNPNVVSAATAWDNAPCSPDAANALFGEIADMVREVRNANATLKNVVIVGGDDIMPMARVADYTTLSNESDYTTALLRDGTGPTGTPLAAAAAQQNILTDDPLADLNPIPWLDHQLYVPDLAVGRLVESPADVKAQVDSFLLAGGMLDPKKSLTTGYDFLSDGSNAVNDALTKIPAASKATLINETWARTEALGALFPAGAAPDVASINAHYDHNRSLPALGNSTQDESDLITVADMQAHPNTLTRKLIFTMGCHAGLSVPDAYVGETSAKAPDWAQAYSGSDQAAAVYFANTGFGYGDTTAVALSEELMRQFAGLLNGSVSVGEAAMYAKQGYFGQLGAYGPYDEKAMQEATLYGFPMWKIAGGTPAVPAPPAVTPGTADANGVASATINVNPTFNRKISAAGGTFFVPQNGSVQVTQYRPIQPKLPVDVTPPVGTGDAHGVLITGLASTDEPVVPAMARPVVDLAANEPSPPAGDVAFPTSFQTLTEYSTPAGEREVAVLMPGQFFKDGEGAGGIQRLFTDIDAEVKYSNSTDFTAPFLTNVAASITGGVLQLSVTADDYGAGSVVLVNALVHDATGWHLVTLAPTAPNSTTYTGTLAIVGDNAEYIAQAQDNAGNVGITTNKGQYFAGQPVAEGEPAANPTLVPQPGQPNGNNGWYKGTVQVGLTNTTEGVTYTATVDSGGAQTVNGTIPVTGDGSHIVKVSGDDGSKASLVVVIDGGAPTITVTPDRQPNASGWYNAPVTIDVTCADAVSGIVTCPADTVVSQETAAAGQVVGGDAYDFAGNTANATKTIKLDKTAPGIVINGVVDGGEYYTAPTPSCTSTDGLSGPGPCTGSVSTGSLPGTYTYTGLATDLAGNTFAKSVTYKLKYIFSGFLQPVNDTAHQVNQTHSIFPAGSAVPLKFKLTKPDGTPVQANSTPTFLSPQRLNAIASGVPNEAAVIAPATSGWTFTWDPVAQQYSYNWKTDKKGQAGYYWRVGVLLDGVTYTVIIGLK